MRAKRPAIRGAPNPLPVPIQPSGPVGLPQLTEQAQLEDDLKAYARAVSHDDVAALKATSPAVIDRLRARWRAVDQPATADQIATEVLRLTTTMPSAGNIDQNMLADTLCEDVADLRPTAFALACGCQAHRRNSEFLSFAKLAQEIRDAEYRACRHYREVLQHDLPALIRSAEAELRRYAQETEEYLRKKRKEYEQLQRDWGPDLPEGFHTDDGEEPVADE
jgi:hypothetical protein